MLFETIMMWRLLKLPYYAWLIERGLKFQSYDDKVYNQSIDPTAAVDRPWCYVIGDRCQPNIQYKNMYRAKTKIKTQPQRLIFLEQHAIPLHFSFHSNSASLRAEPLKSALKIYLSEKPRYLSQLNIGSQNDDFSPRKKI